MHINSILGFDHLAAGYRTFNRLAPHYRPMLKQAWAAQGYQQQAFYLKIYFNGCNHYVSVAILQ
jgi:hypothetical protein